MHAHEYNGPPSAEGAEVKSTRRGRFPVGWRLIQSARLRFRLNDFPSLKPASPVSEIVPLEALAENESARVVELVGPEDWCHRLEELGLRVGCLVRLIKRGEPCLLALSDQRLSLRCDPSTMVLVEPVPVSNIG